ncbi:MAG: heavy-metal-associated domain-containing protein [Burkholderiaceae bacterium]|jgi:copper chaperone|nr:heavy-metal-associated domain-containing protein [Burkholderiaceae bacterium]
MITFQVDDMTCGHCASTITKAVKATDPDARIQIDLAAHRVQVEPVSADADALATALTGAGYTPVRVETAQSRAPAASGGCCCGPRG